MLTPNSKVVAVRPKSPAVAAEEADPEIDETLELISQLDANENEEEKIDSPDTLQKRVFRLNPLTKLKKKITATVSRDSTVSISRSLSQTGSHTPPNCVPDAVVTPRRPSHLQSIDTSKLSSRSGSVASSRSSHSSRSHSKSSHSNRVSSINSESSYNTQWSRGSNRSSLSSLSSMEWDSKNMKKWTKSKLKHVLFRCTRHGRYKEVRSMLEKGVNPNMSDEYGNTILIVAAQNGSKRLVKTALRYNANINQQNYRGNTATHYAFAYGYRTLAEYMLSKGADDRLKNDLGLLCYHGISNADNGVKKGKDKIEKKKTTLPDVNQQCT